MKELLMIAYYYPPLGGIGSLRPLKFSRYLSEYGWNTTVLTVLNDPDYTKDETLLSETPSNQQVIRAIRLPIYRTLRRFAKKGLRRYHLLYSFVDAQFDWVPDAVRAGSELLKSRHIDAIYATAPPYSCLRVASQLRKKFGLPTLADLRDPFSSNDFMVWPTRFHKCFYRLYETKLLGQMDQVVVVNKLMQKDVAVCMGLSRLNPTVIPNGFDTSDFVGQTDVPPADRFVMGHVGSIYGALSPRPFFQSLAIAIQERPEIRQRTNVVFLGRVQPDFIYAEARKHLVDSLVRVPGFSPHQEAIAFMHRCHVLLLFGVMDTPSVVPAKLYEYIATGRPVLSFSAPGFLEDFILENEFGFSTDGSKPELGAARIVELFDAFDQGKPIPGPTKEKYERFSRRSLTGKLAKVLDSMI